MMMNIISPKSVFILGVLLTAFGLGVFAQNTPPPQEASQFEEQEPRPKLLENLGLVPDQIRQIRMLNRDRKPVMQAAQQRLREASRALDMSIYGDSLDENMVEIRITEFQQAQAEVAKIRFQSEVALRKILTPEQLTKFRELRARVAETRRKAQRRRQGPARERPLRRIRQLPGRSRIN